MKGLRSTCSLLAQTVPRNLMTYLIHCGYMLHLISYYFCTFQKKVDLGFQWGYEGRHNVAPCCAQAQARPNLVEWALPSPARRTISFLAERLPPPPPVAIGKRRRRTREGGETREVGRERGSPLHLLLLLLGRQSRPLQCTWRQASWRPARWLARPSPSTVE